MSQAIDVDDGLWRYGPDDLAYALELAEAGGLEPEHAAAVRAEILRRDAQLGPAAHID